MKKNQGFSVIEIILVLGVIGILSSFIVPKVRNYLAVAKDAKAVNTVQSLRMASESFFLEEGHYSTMDKNNMKKTLDDLKKYIGDKLVLTGQSLLLDIGGSKERSNGKNIKYGGKVEVDINSNKEFYLKPYDGTYEYNMRGEKWSDI